MMQQDFRSINAYILGIVSLVLALFIPIAILILRVFKPMVAAFVLGVGIPLIAIIVGVLGFVKALKHQTPIARTAKILSAVSILIGIVLVVFNLYIFIKSGGLSF
jgi:uncharacterized membrane protein HdeD (DUF308 family)